MGVDRWCIGFPLLWGRGGWEFRELWQPDPKPEGFPPAFTDGSANQCGCPSTNNDVASTLRLITTTNIRSTLSSNRRQFTNLVKYVAEFSNQWSAFACACKQPSNLQPRLDQLTLIK